MKKLLGLMFMFFTLALTTCSAANWYTSPTGTGNGTLASPFALQTALSSSLIQPGDTIWLLGGTYSGNFTASLNGTATAPIIVRNYMGQRATLDGTGCGALVLSANGTYTWFWGLEVLDSVGPRLSTGPGVCKAFGIGVYGGPGNKFINCIVHDTSEGFSAYNASPDSEYYGNVVYYNGYIGSDRNYGHGFYIQNDTGTKLIQDNITGDNGFEGIQVYGSGSADLVNITLDGNAWYNTDSWPYPNNYQYNIIVAGGATRSGIVVTNNMSYFPVSSAVTTGYLSIGGYTDGQDASITGNVFVGGYTTLEVNDQAGPVSVTGNTIVSGAGSLRLVNFGLDTGQTESTYTWNQNTYYDNSGYGFYIAQDSGNYAFSNWQSLTGFDTNSTYQHGYPEANQIFVLPNRYEAKRANIIIYNWQNLPTISADLSRVLTAGDQYIVTDTQNYYGPPVAQGTYSGGLVSIPMTGLTKAAILGTTTPPHTAPAFGTFIVSVPATSTTLPNPASALTAVPSSTGTAVALSWAASTTAGVAYDVYRSTVSGGPYTAIAAGQGVSTLTYTDSGLMFGTYYYIVRSILNGVESITSNEASVMVTGGTPTATAAFLAQDTTTQGKWASLYGIDGYSIANGGQVLPSYATFAVSGQTNYTWAASSTDPRALLDAGTGIASCWYGTSFSLDVNITGGTREVALYALDWDQHGGTRGETIQITDYGTGARLNTQTLTNFVNGVYLSWNISGHVTITVTRTAGADAVLSGIFFGGGSGSTGAATTTAAFVKFDPVPSPPPTQGSWQGVYGGAGYSIANSVQSLPSWVTLSVSGEQSYTWATGTTQTRDLQFPGGSGRIATCWYGATTFTIDINLTDGAVHQVAIYAEDWDGFGGGRAETFQLVDAASGTVLDTEKLTYFGNGIWAVWNVSGNVLVNVINNNTESNAAVSGVFFQ